MYEFTEYGTPRWSALDPEEKRLVAIYGGMAAVPWLLGIVQIGLTGYYLGRSLRPAERAYSGADAVDHLVASPTFSLFVAIAILCTLISGWAWWRLSARQDEMFSRIQNYALSRAGIGFLAVATLWWLASVPGWVGAFPLGLFVYLAMISIPLFTMIALKRWV